jgi:Protein of unknown function (DUF1254)
VSRSTIVLIVGLFLCPVLSCTARAQSAITEQEAQSIAADAYIYFYPLVTMDVTRKQLTNRAPGPGVFGGPMNMFVNVEAFPSADFKAVVRPNFDTLYSSGYLDLTKEPMVVSVPDRRALLSPAYARHVVGRIRVAWLAHHGNASGQFPRHATKLERNGTGRILRKSKRLRPTSGSLAALRLMVRRIMMPFTRFKLVTRSHRSRIGARRPSRSR